MTDDEMRRTRLDASKTKPAGARGPAVSRVRGSSLSVVLVLVGACRSADDGMVSSDGTSTGVVDSVTSTDSGADSATSTPTLDGSSSSDESGTGSMCGDGIALVGEVCFGPPQTMTLDTPAYQILAADLDDDGLPEILLTTIAGIDVWSSTGRTLSLVDSISLVASPIGLAAADVDGDGAIDVLAGVASDFWIEVLLNDGAGKLEFSQIVVVDGPADNMALADLDDDDHVDLVLPFSPRIQSWSGQGDGSFAWTSTEMVGQRPGHTALVDMNDDGFEDAVVPLGNCHGLPYEPMGFCERAVVAVLPGTGDGAFVGPGASYELDAYDAHRVLVEDLDLDGRRDVLAITSHCYRTGIDPHCRDPTRVAFLASDDTGALVEPTYFEAASGHIDARSGSIADIDGDGHPDAVFGTNGIDEQSGYVAVVLADPNPTLVEIEAGPRIHELVTADLDGDGAIDVIISNAPEPTLTVVFGDP